MKALTNGLARAAVRFKPAAFAGTFVALAMAALIVCACGILLETGLRASVPPSRYAAAPVVAEADQSIRFTIGSGESRTEVSRPVPDRARLKASLADDIAKAPGVARAVADVTYPALLNAGSGKGGPAASPAASVTVHGWGSTAFTGTRLSDGGAPGSGEAVLDAAAARAAGVSVGDRVTVTAADGPHRVRVRGLTRASTGPATGPTVWFSDAEARRLSGHPGAVDAIAVLPAPGTTTAELARAVTRAVGDRAEVRTGEDRGAVETPGMATAEETLTGLGGSFGGVAAMVAAFTAAGTVALCVGQRSREFALLRAIGATPRQLRRSIATEALLVAPAAGLLGCLPGIALARWWFGELKDRGAVPEALQLHVSWLPLVSAVGVSLLTALIAGAAAARRPARIKPGQALAESSVERTRPGTIRTVLGVAAAAGGVSLGGLAAASSGDNAANAASGIVFLFMLAVALLGPLIARACAWLMGLPMRAASASAGLAAANSRANARRLASAITPIVLAMAFASTLVFLHTSEEHATGAEQRAAVTADRVLTAPAGGPGLPAGARAEAAAVDGVRTAVGVLRTSVLIPTGSGEGRELRGTSAQGISGTGRELAAVQDLGVRTGSLDALTTEPGTVAVDRRLADSAGVRTGDRLRMRLPDGTAVAPKVVATYDRGLGTAQVTLPRAALAAHVTAAFDTDILLRTHDTAAAPQRAAAAPATAAAPARGGPDKALAALGTVTDRDGLAASRSVDREVNAWANYTMAAVLGGFAAAAAANTLVMTIADRRRELGTLRLIGSTRRQVLRMVRWEALLVALSGIGLGTAIALATLGPMARALTGEGPYIPPHLYAAFALSALALGLAATALPARAALRSRP